jgi:uncharacterized caspase-like protein
MLRILALLVVGAAPINASEPQKPLIFLASQSGKQTLDAGEGGGNPFASALIELLARPGMKLGDLPHSLSELTSQKSQGVQQADVPLRAEPATWRIQPVGVGETRVALVLVISDYAASDSAQSLPGARLDAHRVSEALRQAGFETQTVVDPKSAQLRAALDGFAIRSGAADVALLYTTGHGVEVKGNIHLLLGDYPVAQGSGALATHSVRLAEIAASAKGRRASLVFYGGCRDNPFSN